MKILTLLAVVGIIAMVFPMLAVKAASTSDMAMMQQQQQQQHSSSNDIGPGTSGNKVLPNEDQHLTAIGSTEAPTNTTVAKSLVITAIPDKPIVATGKPEIIHVKAAMENGTGLSNVTIRSMIIDYVTSKEKVVLGGKTDKKGELDLTANIGQHAKAGQFLALINATAPDGQEKGISTGFVVVDKGGSSSSGSSGSTTDSKGRCSGSGCR
jgi:hypothetical protein